MFNNFHPPSGGNHHQMLPNPNQSAQQPEDLRVAIMHRTPLFGKMQRDWRALSPFFLRSNNPACDFDSLDQIQDVSLGSPLQCSVTIDLRCCLAIRKESEGTENALALPGQFIVADVRSHHEVLQGSVRKAVLAGQTGKSSLLALDFKPQQPVRLLIDVFRQSGKS